MGRIKDRRCDYPGCGRKHHSKGWCHSHYLQERKGEGLKPLRVPKQGCDYPGCQKPHQSLGLCSGHYEQQRKGQPLTDLLEKRPRAVDPLEYARRKFTVTAEYPTCWTWTGGTDGRAGESRYGQIGVDGAIVKVHRFMWERLVGPLGPGMEVDHLCQNKTCGNPAHLQATSGTDHREVTTRRRRELGKVKTYFPALQTEWSAGDRPMPSSEALAYAQRHRLPYYLLGVWHHVGGESEGSR